MPHRTPLSRTLLLLIGLSLAVTATPAAALTCEEQVQALFDGPLDPWQRPPHRNTRTLTDGSGTVTAIWDDVIEAPDRSITVLRDSGHAGLVYGRDSWAAPGPDGPWTKADFQMPLDLRERSATFLAGMREGVSELECNGTVERDGTAYLAYRFRSQTPPDPSMNNGVFGEMNAIWLDPTGERVLIWERSEMVTPWAPVPDGTRQVDVLSYDPSIVVLPPEP